MNESSASARPPGEERDHPHACLEGWHYIGHMVESADDLDGEVELYERVPCRRCAEERSKLRWYHPSLESVTAMQRLR